MNNSSKPNNNHNNILTIPATQIIHLIQHHLLESGLTSSFQSVQNETQLGCTGLFQHVHVQLIQYVKNGEWGLVLDLLSTLQQHQQQDKPQDGQQQQREQRNVLARVHEMAILELGDLGEMELAFATLKLSRHLLEECQEGTKVIFEKSNNNQDDDDDYDKGEETLLSSSMSLLQKNNLAQSVERKLHALHALRTSIHATHASTSTATTGITSTQSLLPKDYYGNGLTKQKRRDDISKELGHVIPIIPQSRLTSLVQQAIKWQVHTGSMPMIRDKWYLADNEEEKGEEGTCNNDDDDDEDNKKKTKKRKKNRPKRKFDLLLGEVDVLANNKTSKHAVSASNKQQQQESFEKIPLDPYSFVKFSKKTRVTSATFYTDVTCNKVSLISGSSDGFIEIWDEESKYTDLRLDLDYQKKDELMCHYSTNDDDNSGGKDTDAPSILALAVNSDGAMLASGDSQGTIHIWNIKKGSCIRSFDKVHGGAITCLNFSRDGDDSTRILSASQDGTAREFGLRTSRMLKEFAGHGSFVNYCNYVLSDKLYIVTASADGTVRIWDGRSAELTRILNPSATTGPSAVVGLAKKDAVTNDANIHTVINLHTPANSMIIIARGPKAYLVTYTGVILRTYSNDVSLVRKKGKESSSCFDDFITGTISPSNKWLYAVTAKGVCMVFDIASGKVEKTIQDFGIESTGGKANYEVTGVVHHPHKGMLGAYSTSSGLKRGLLTLWK